MRLSTIALVVLAGCAAEEDPWVVRPPGGHGQNGGGFDVPIDAAVDAANLDGSGATGRLCVVTDVRDPLDCPDVTTLAGVLVERVGTASTATAGADGAFTLDLPPGAIIRAGAGSTTLRTSVSRVELEDPAVRLVPVPTAAAWTSTLGDMGATMAAGNGAVVIRTVTSAGTPAAGVAYDLPPEITAGPFYDGASAAEWTTGGGTGPLGTAVMVDLPPGQYTFTGSAGAEVVTVGNVQVHADAVTFVRGTLAP